MVFYIALMTIKKKILMSRKSRGSDDKKGGDNEKLFKMQTEGANS